MRILINNVLTVLQKQEDIITKRTSILIEDDKILTISHSEDFEDIDKTIDGSNRLVIPGLVNAHTHSYMSLFRNYADDLPFSTWLFDKILPLEDKLTSEDAYWGSMLGIMEMINTGTTCFADMYMFANQTCRAVEESGIRACLSRGLVGFGDDEGGIRRLSEAKNEICEWKNKANGRITFMLGPHAPYTCGPRYLERVINEAAELRISLNTHLAESRNEIRDIHDKYGVTPTEYLNSIGFF